MQLLHHCDVNEMHSSHCMPGTWILRAYLVDLRNRVKFIRLW